MRDTDLYSRLLGVSAPWSVTLVELNKPESEVIVTVRYSASAPVFCPTCGTAVPRYDHRSRRWRHLDTMQFRTYLDADVPRVNCPEHGVQQIGVPWAEPGSRFTALFESLVIDWLSVGDTSAVARMLNVSWSAVDGIMRRAVARGLQRRNTETVVDISVDETSFQRRHEYVTVVTDNASGRVLYVADDRTSESLRGFFSELTDEQRAGIRTVSMDMWPAYINVARDELDDAEAKVCFDKFHVAQHLGNAVDRVRRAEQKQLRLTGDERLKGMRYHLLENPDRMSLKRWREFEALRQSALKTARAWAIKEHAMCLWHYTSRTWAEKQWKRWLAWALRSRLEPVRRVARMVRKHLHGIINAIILKKTNAQAESTNARIQKLKSRACGYRNRDRFRTAIMFHCGGLDLYPSLQMEPLPTR